MTDVLTREITVLDPRTGETVGRVPIATPPETERALRRARSAADGWTRTPAAERAAALHAAARVVAGVGTLVQYAELGPVHRGRTLHGRFDATDFMVPGPRGVQPISTVGG